MKRVFVAEDDADIVFLCREILTEEGYEVESGYGTAALAAILARPPDLVLLDCAMAGMDGTEILTEMRKHPETTQIPVIVMTAIRHPEVLFTGYVVQAYLLKPWEIAALIGVVRNWVAP